jgi:competence protein ComEA
VAGILRAVHRLWDRLRARLEPAGLSPAEGLALLVLVGGAVSLTVAVWAANHATPVPATPSELPGQELTSPDEETGPDPRGSGSSGAPGAGSGGDGAPDQPAGDDHLVVHVAGHVVRPGLVRLRSGARVADALDAAGGPTAQAVLDALNLARPVVDGEQVRVPAEGEEVAAPPADTPAAADAPLDLNAATAEQLQQLPGVGPVTAQRIVDHRTAIGGFADVSQLLEVAGIGPARFADLEPRVRIGP